MKLQDEALIYAHWPYYIEYGEELETDCETEKEFFQLFLERYSDCCFQYEEEEEFAKPYFGRLFGSCINVKIYKNESTK